MQEFEHSPPPDHQRYVRKVTLPSGKTIEVISFDDDLAPADAICTCAPNAPPSSSIPSPGTRPSGSRWEVSLRCPNCEWAPTDTFEEEPSSASTRRSTAAPRRSSPTCAQLTRANMEDDVERFIAALNAEYVLPEDF